MRAYTLRLIEDGMTRDTWRLRKSHYNRHGLENGEPYASRDRAARHRNRRRHRRQLQRFVLRRQI